ncbi:LysR substrate-binding domain-containing protein [Sorangium sp. So ce117]
MCPRHADAPLARSAPPGPRSFDPGPSHHDARGPPFRFAAHHFFALRSGFFYLRAPLLAACLAGQGIAQVIELYVREHLADGRLVQVLPEWAEETYPLYAYHHSAQLMSVKVRAFLEFVVALTRA